MSIVVFVSLVEESWLKNPNPKGFAMVTTEEEIIVIN